MTPSQHPVAPAQSTGDADARDLARFGYRQELQRTLGAFSSFAAGFSYLGILTGVFQLFAFGFAVAGPGFWWTWPAVLAGQLMVALCFAELAGQYPLAGSVYQWSKQIGGAATSWMAGWLLIVGGIVTVAAVATAYQVLLPQISDAFQLVGGPDDVGVVASPNGAKNAIILGGVLVVFAVVVNVIGVKLVGRINNLGVIAELGGTVLLIVLLLLSVTRGPDVVTETLGTGAAHSSGYIGALLVAALMGGYVLYGFDTAGSLAEETEEPRRLAPRAIIRALLAAGLMGTLLILFALMAVGDLDAEGLTAQGLTYIVKDVLGDGFGTAFLIVAAIASTVCALAIMAAVVRIIFALARDGRLPFSHVLSRVSPRSRTPIAATLVVGLGALGLLAFNIGNQQVFYTLVAVAIVMFYLAYLLVTVPLLIARLRDRWPRAEHGPYFSLGRWGLPVNVLAVAWGAAMAFNIAWPRADIYGDAAWYLQYGAYVFVGGTVLLGGIWYLLVERKRPSRALPEHAAEAETIG